MNQTSTSEITQLYQESFQAHWQQPVFSDYEGISYTYGEAAQVINQVHCFFKEQKITPGDKIALLGRNSSNWAITFIATMGYGAIAVPILPDFNSSDVHQIIEHSESKILFALDALYEKLDIQKMNNLQAIIGLPNFTVLNAANASVQESWEKSFKKGAVPEIKAGELNFKKINNEDLAVISYTSGTSGFTKGVMIPARSLYSNVLFARENMPLKAEDKIVSFLPMAHVFGLLFEFLFPVTMGCHITFLTKPPTPQVIIKAFKEIQPHLILSVPLVIEKIYKKRILPTLEKPVMKVLMRIPGISSILKKKVKEKLVETFGGRFHEIVIGGAPLSKDVEKFFRKIKFPFTIGYGMTECGPLISYDAWKTTQPSSAGKLVDRMEVKIDSADPFNVVGEIMVKGENVMLGYYKNDEATQDAIDADGWLHTGDLGLIDENNYIFIKGRSKNMLLGPSGQNIYPEEIEAKLSNLPYVQECVVIDREGVLIALVYAEPESVEADQLNDETLVKAMEENRVHANKELPKYSQISKIELMNEEFEKTPKRNIKRYLYTN